MVNTDGKSVGNITFNFKSKLWYSGNLLNNKTHNPTIKLSVPPCLHVNMGVCQYVGMSILTNHM